MHSMVKSLAAAMILGGVVVAGCSGDDDGGGGGGGGADDGQAAPSGFCEGAQEVSDLIAEAAGAQDVAAIVGQMEQIDPPEDISDDWETMVDIFNTVAQAGTETSGEIPDAPVDQEQAVAASDNVNSYIQDECGFGFGQPAGAGEGAAPTSSTGP
jgi:hypothetical protein